MKSHRYVRRGVEGPHIFTLLLTSLLLLLAACPNWTNRDNLKSIPESMELTGYYDIEIIKNTPIAEQKPTLTNLPEDNITFTYSISPTIPAGLKLDDNTGLLSGTPTTQQATVDYTITATPQDDYSGTREAAISIRIDEKLPETVTLTGYSVIDTSENTAIKNQTPMLTNLPEEEDITYIYSLSPAIPNGLKLDVNTGILSGTPTTPQAATDYTITATFQRRYIGTVDTTISIRITGDVPEVVELTGYSDIQILKDTQITEQNPAPLNLPAEGISFTYSISPVIPVGLKLDDNTGLLSGTPAIQQVSANYTITATAQDPYSGAKEATISIAVYKVQATGKAHLLTLIDDELALNGNLNLIDTSLVTDMSELFKDKTNFNEDISAWNVSKVTNMTSMFHGAEAFNQSLKDWDVSNVITMKSMFRNATSFNQNLNDWEVSNVENMSQMFYGAASFHQNLNDWEVSNVGDMSQMFYGAASFNQNLNDWDVSNVGDMSQMFYDAASFNQNLNGWDVSNVEVMEYMFGGAKSFNQDLNDWDVSKVEIMNYMFSGATSFNGNISDWTPISLINAPAMFKDATSFNGDISSWPLPEISLLGGMFNGATAFNQNLDSWGQYIDSSVSRPAMFKDSGIEDNPPTWYN